jgi:hypothetical protein
MLPAPPMHGYFPGQMPGYPMPGTYPQPVPVWMQPGSQYALPPLPAGYPQLQQPIQQQHQHQQQGRKRADAPVTDFVDPRAEELKRAKPEQQPDQLVAQLSQLQKLAALQAKLDAIKNAKK